MIDRLGIVFNVVGRLDEGVLYRSDYFVLSGIQVSCSPPLLSLYSGMQLYWKPRHKIRDST
jgi:hypothetical protein